ncbi:MAG TPA: hypothetical protein VJ768_10310 [Anaerolineales bacterium]|nr:hypothetical protein [Anaerolineales bacterium]
MDRQALKRRTPDPIWRSLSGTYWWWRNRGRHTLARSASLSWRRNLRRLEPYRDRHRGRRCFIIGNGPSLRRTDLTSLRNEFTFGLNRIYLLFPEMGFTTTYLVSVNELVLEQCAGEMLALDLPRFVTWRARGLFPDNPNILFLDTDFTGPEEFSGDLAGRVYEGYTVTFVALQLAFAMGFEQAILVGVDHNFETQGPPNTTVTSTGDDPNHFAPNYFGAGFRWQLPDLEGSERAYRLARDAYSAAGRQILDATVEGKLTVFPKVDYSSLFTHARTGQSTSG